MKIISTKMHGVLDYVYGVALLLAPNLFGFADLGGPAVLIPRVLGVLVLGQALITRYELGVFKVLPLPMHLMMDVVVGALLAASPFLFGFSDQPANAWAPHVVVGLLIVGGAFMTQTRGRNA